MNQIKKVLINATNLNEGGGVQVATSFLKDLVLLGKLQGVELIVFVSLAVNRNLEEKFFDKNFFSNYQIVNPKEISFINSYKLNEFDIVFTIFGPIFLPFFKKRHICGFAQPWVIYPVGDVLKKFSLMKRLLMRLKYTLVSYVFRQSSILIVESNHIKNLLLKKGYKNQIEVVENAVSSIFFKKNEWQVINSTVFDPKKINIGILSGSYHHKNLRFVILLANKLEKIYPNTFKFIFTLPQRKFNELKREIRYDTVVNLGVITLQQCPSFYHQIDGVILPSLLECFSITPYESMLMKKIIFLSDREFFTTQCHNHAIYFDPLSVESAIKVLVQWYFDKSNSQKIFHLDSAYKYIIKREQSNFKAESYIKLIMDSN